MPQPRSEFDQSQKPEYRSDDEIDLRELVSIVIDGWKWIVFTPLVALVLAGILISTSSTSYTTEFTAIKAEQDQFQSLTRADDIQVNVNRLFFNFTTQLSSFDNFRQIVTQSPDLLSLQPEELEDDRALLRLFNNRFSVNRTDSDSLTVQHNYPADEDGVATLSAFIDLTADRVWQNTVRRLEALNSGASQRLERRITIEQRIMRAARENRLFELEQAVGIANQLGVELPTTPQDYGRQPRGDEVIYANIGTDGALPLYFLGHRALQAEKESVETAIDRSLQDGSIRNLEARLQEHISLAEIFQAATLENFMGVSELKPVERLTTVIAYPYQPVSPNGSGRTLILALALVLGGFVGLMMTFISRFITSIRNYRQQINREF